MAKMPFHLHAVRSKGEDPKTSQLTSTISVLLSQIAKKTLRCKMKWV
jgi:hypothetical protein